MTRRRTKPVLQPPRRRREFGGRFRRDIADDLDREKVTVVEGSREQGRKGKARGEAEEEKEEEAKAEEEEEEEEEEEKDREVVQCQVAMSYVVCRPMPDARCSFVSLLKVKWKS